MVDRGRIDRVLFITHPEVTVDRKAVQAGEILAQRLGVPLQILHELGENDRSAPGFLEPHVCQTTADRFFAEPDSSADGWETATAAQARIDGDAP